MAGSFFIASAVALVSLSKWTTVAAQNQQGCVTNYDPNTDYFPTKSTLAPDAPNIRISYTKNVKTVLDVKNNHKYLLYQCGTQAPTDSTATAIIEVPIKSVAVEDTTALTYLELLGARSTIKYTTNTEYITSPCILKANIPTIASVGTANNTAQRNEVNVTLTWGTPGNKVVKFPATADDGTLHRSQWLHFLAAFYNKEAEGNALTAKIAAEYNCVKSRAATAAAAEGTPAVSFTSNYQQTWYLGSPYLDRYAADAGAKKPANYTPSTSYNAQQIAAFDAILRVSDIVVDQSNFPDLNAFYNASGVSTATADAYTFAKNKAVWSNDKLNSPTGLGNAWFQSAVVMEHVVLADMLTMFHPKALSGYTRTYFRDLDSGEAKVKVAASDCPDVTAALTLPTVCSGALEWARGTGFALVTSILVSVVFMFEIC